MDTKTLMDALRSLEPGNYQWKLALYSVSKGRDGIELEWNLCPMQGIALQVGRLRDYLLKKPVADKPVSEYCPFLSDKENIGFIDEEDEMIREQIGGIIANIQNAQAYAPQDYVTGVMPKPTGYGFYGECMDEQGNSSGQVLLMRRGNPFVSGASAPLFMGEEEDVIPCQKPILKFATAVDFVLIAGGCYILSSSIEKDFALENRQLAITQRQLNKISQAQIVSNFDLLEQTALKAKNARKFIDFDSDILAHIARLSIPDREDFLGTYGITIDPIGNMESFDQEQCELIIDLLCCRSCLDPLGRLSLSSNITPRE